MPRDEWETSAVFHELVDQIRALEDKLFEGPNVPLDDQGVLEGYKWIFSILQVALDAHVWADPARPRFVDIVGPVQEVGRRQRRRLLPVRADRSEPHVPGHRPPRRRRVPVADRVRRARTTAATPSASSSTVNDRMLDFDADGRFEFDHRHPSPTRCARSRATTSSTRTTDRRTEFHIEALDPPATLSRGRRRSRPPLPRRAHVGARAGEHRAARTGRAEHGRRALPGPDDDVRLGGGRRRVRDGQLRPRGRRGAGDRRPLARVRVLEPVPLEPVPPHVQLRLRAGHDQRRPGRLRAPTARGGSSSPHATRGCRTGSRPRATRAAACGSAGSIRRRHPIVRVRASSSSSSASDDRHHRRPGRPEVPVRGGSDPGAMAEAGAAIELEPADLLRRRPRKPASTTSVTRGACRASTWCAGASPRRRASAPAVSSPPTSSSRAVAQPAAASRICSSATPRSSSMPVARRSSSSACRAPAPRTCTTCSRPIPRCGRFPTGRASSRCCPGGEEPATGRAATAPRWPLEVVNTGAAVLRAHARDDGRPRARGDPAARHRLLVDALRDDGADADLAATTTASTTRRPHYAYLKKVLQVLSGCAAATAGCSSRRSTSSSSRRCSRTFPDATFVVTHRDPVAVTASLGHDDRVHGRASTAIPSTRADRPATGPTGSRRCCAACVDDRDLLPDDQAIDVRFDEFMADDVAMVERVYAVADQPFTPEVRSAMDDFMATHARGRHGGVTYRFEDVGLDAAERRRALAFYMDRFEVTPEH